MKTENLTEENIREAEKIDDKFRVNVGNLLENKVAIITGCSSGIGAATSKVFLEAGAKVVGCYFSEADERLYPNAILGVRKYLEKQRYVGNFRSWNLDVADEKTPETLVKGTLTNFGRIDILCNFAGIAIFSRFDETSREKYKKTLDTNLNGHFFLTQKVVESMKKNDLPYPNSSRGSIINMSSMTGAHQGEDGVIDYGITKSAMVGFMRGLATELGSHRIRANCISPGYILTPIQIRDYTDEKRRNRVIERTAIPRFGLPREVANAALYLASDLSSFVTGAEILVDGGIVTKFQLE